jgi:hypothetical protein
MAAQRQGGEDLINWKEKCLELARLIDRHRRERMLADKLRAWKLAQKILKEVISE